MTAVFVTEKGLRSRNSIQARAAGETRQFFEAP